MSVQKEFSGAFKEKPDISTVFLQQLDRVNQSAGTPMYKDQVEELARMLPMSSLKYVKEQKDRYTVTKIKFIHPLGFKCGTRDNPTLIDERTPVRLIPVLNEDSKVILDAQGKPVTMIDWNDPNILSPKLVTETYIDYGKMREIIMEASEQSTISWQEEHTNSIKGKKDD